MVKFLLFAFVFLFNTSVFAGFFGNPCKNSPKLKLNFNVNYGTPKYVYNFTDQRYKDIIFKAKQQLHDFNGFTYAEFRTSVGVNALKPEVHENYVCYYIENAEVEIGYPNILVFLTDEYAKGSCEYNAIISHENTHVNIHQRSLQQFVPFFRKTLYQVFSEKSAGFYVKAGFNDSKKSIKQKIKNKLSNFVKEVMSEKKIKKLTTDFEKARNQANQTLDSDFSYKDTYKKCSNW